MSQPSQSGPKQTWQRGAAPSSAVTPRISASPSASPPASSALGVDWTGVVASGGGVAVSSLIAETPSASAPGVAVSGVPASGGVIATARFASASSISGFDSVDLPSVRTRLWRTPSLTSRTAWARLIGTYTTLLSSNVIEM